ncbi:MAG: hypothetical protein U0667_03970 [Chloroflexota bacterium]
MPQGDFCTRGGRFGPHNVHEPKPGSLIDGDTIYLTYFNGGLRVVILDAADPQEIAWYVLDAPPGQASCQLNDVTVGEDGLIWVTDRLGGGLHVLELAAMPPAAQRGTHGGRRRARERTHPAGPRPAPGAGWPCAAMDPGWPDLPHGDVLVEDGVIWVVGTDLAAIAGDAEAIDADRMVVMGMVGAHEHPWAALFRGVMGDRDGRDSWSTKERLGTPHGCRGDRGERAARVCRVDPRRRHDHRRLRA